MEGNNRNKILSLKSEHYNTSSLAIKETQCRTLFSAVKKQRANGATQSKKTKQFTICMVKKMNNSLIKLNHEHIDHKK